MEAPPQIRTDDEDHLLVGRLRARDESAFIELVEHWTPAMLRVARGYVSTQAAAEDVVQETWLGVLNGIDRFEERASLKTWVFRILSNRAKTRGERDRRSVPFSSLAGDEIDGPVVAPQRFLRPDHHEYPRHWDLDNGFGPADWGNSPEDRVLRRDGLRHLRAAIDTLPRAQRAVITLRDVEGFPSEEVCHLLDISADNQRVLLHRARSRVRAALENELAI